MGPRRGVEKSVLLIAVFAAVCAVLVLAGCGGGGSSSSGSTAPAPSGSTSSAGSGSGSEASSKLAAIKASVQEQLKAPTSIGEFTPIKKPIPTDKTVAFLQCAVSCGEIAEGLEEAVSLLGWNLKKIQLGSSPAEIGKGWSQAVQEHPDAVIASGNPSTLFSKQLSELHSMGIPYFGCCTDDKVGDGMEIVISGPPEQEKRGEMMAEWVLAEKGTEANVILFTIPDYPVLKYLDEGFERKLAEVCPECHVSVEDAEVSDIGTKLPAKVVSAVQKNPEANYIGYGFGAMAIGVPQALRAAGLSEQVKSIDADPEAANLEAIANEEVETAAIPFDNELVAWMCADAAARFFAGEKVEPERYEYQPLQFLDAEGIEDPSKPYTTVADYQDQFKELWGK